MATWIQPQDVLSDRYRVRHTIRMGECGFVVISGLPAAGKTTLGKVIASELGFPFLDKDDLLEASFEQHHSIDPAMRQALSRTADDEFIDRASRLPSAVLVSFWRPPGRSVTYGTPTAWLGELALPVVELHCLCSPEIAQNRFKQRRRHPAHNDRARRRDLEHQFGALAELGPLGPWPCVTVDTSDRHDLATNVAQALRQLRALLG